MGDELNSHMQQPLWNAIQTPEFDYQTLMHALQNYAKPRDRVTTLLKQGVIRRVKKGLYIFGEEYGRNPYSREILSNLIYGPSYISLEYALHHYGLIPEEVKAITAVCIGSLRKFDTPAGLFTYRQLPSRVFYYGVERFEVGEGRAFLMANPEKALMDTVKLGHGVTIRSQKEIRQYLIDDLRIDLDELNTLDINKISRYTESYSSSKLRILARFLTKELKRKN